MTRWHDDVRSEEGSLYLYAISGVAPTKAPPIKLMTPLTAAVGEGRKTKQLPTLTPEGVAPAEGLENVVAAARGMDLA